MPLRRAPTTALVSIARRRACQLTDHICAGIVQLDPYLEPFKDALKSRYSKAQQWIKTIEETEGGLEKFSRVSTTKLAV